jgi:SAM-dependent methyltransferase
MAAASAEASYEWSPAKRRQSLATDFDVDRDRFRDADVLEVSAGTSMVNGMSDLGRSVVVVPPGERADRVDRAARVRAVRGRLPFADDSFDAAVTVHGLTNARDPSWLARELHRVVRPGGVLLCEVNAFAAPYAVRRRLSLVDGSHRYHLAPDVVRQVVADAGFTVERATVERDDTPLHDTTAKLLVARFAFGLRRVYLTATATTP